MALLGQSSSTVNDCPRVLRWLKSRFRSLPRISSSVLTTSSAYSLSPRCRHTSAETLTETVFPPPLSSFSTCLVSSSPPHTGHFSNGFIFSPSLSSQSIVQDRGDRL